MYIYTHRQKCYLFFLCIITWISKPGSKLLNLDFFPYVNAPTAESCLARCLLIDYNMNLFLFYSWQVVVDDTLPVGRDGELLSSYSNNRNEMWVSLIEKAYLKVRLLLTLGRLTL